MTKDEKPADADSLFDEQPSYGDQLTLLRWALKADPNPLSSEIRAAIAAVMRQAELPDLHRAELIVAENTLEAEGYRMRRNADGKPVWQKAEEEDADLVDALRSVAKSLEAVIQRITIVPAAELGGES